MSETMTRDDESLVGKPVQRSSSIARAGNCATRPSHRGSFELRFESMSLADTRAIRASFGPLCLA